MTVWEFACCVEGFNDSHSGKPKADISDSEYEVLCALGEKWNAEAMQTNEFSGA